MDLLNNASHLDQNGYLEKIYKLHRTPCRHLYQTNLSKQ